ncbi:MAG TPA: circularly permuted type 2 ATP-grasp protein [Dermatophilaceae bacterium]|nr:circularly permuted type 2 ATP-grasp protein [Dermatophilaceae bacterium]
MSSGTVTSTAYRESTDADGRPRKAWEDVAGGLEQLSATDLERMRGQVDRLLDDDGVSYRPLPGQPQEPQPEEIADAAHLRWRLDPVPLVIDADAWAALERGLLQRSRLLDLLLADIYDQQQILHRGLVDPEVVYGHSGYVRAAHGIRLHASHQLFLHGVDVVRGPGGQFLASGDRTQAPSGVGYAMADRRAVSRVLPEEFARTAPHGLGQFFRTVRRSLEAVAPAGVDEPRIVLLSPGTFSETAFDQAFIAAQLGIPFVGSADLTVRRGRLWMRALGRHEEVHVVLRRVDAEWSDPLDLRPGSRLGVAGLREMCRRGTVSVVNTLGSGVLENAALRAQLPQLCRELLGEDLLLESAPTFWCGSDRARGHVVANLARLHVQPLSGGLTVRGPELSAQQLQTWRDRLRAERGRWVATEPVAPSLAPAAGSDGLHDHPVGMRLFTVAQEGGYAAMRGALGRVVGHHGHPSGDPAEHPVLTAAKDVWVRTPAAAEKAPVVVTAPVEQMRRALAPVTSPRALSDLYWLGRYSERAEDMTRLMLAIRARVDDFRYNPGAEGAGCLPVLMAAVRALVPSAGQETDSYAAGLGQSQSQSAGGQRQSQRQGTRADDTTMLMRSLLVDASRPGSIAQSLAGLHQAAAAVRDQLSVETWIVLAAVDHARDALAADSSTTAASLQTAHTAVLTGMLALSGLAKESMVRDAGWHMMDTGRRVERSQQLTTLLRATLTRALPTPVENLVVESVLSVGESIITHRRRYGGRLRVESVGELLLLDPENPRSLTYQLEAVAENLLALPGASGTSRPERHLHDLLSSLRRSDPAELAEANSEGVREELAELLDGLHTGLRELADLIAAQHFWHQVDMQPLWGPVGVSA